MAKSPNYSVPALEKGLDIIEALAVAAVPQSLGDLAQDLDRSSGELFRMLDCLEQRGYLMREEVSGKYVLTLKLYRLAHMHSALQKLLAASRLPMQLLTERFRESCHLSVLERGELLVVAQYESPEQVRLSIEVGSVFGATATASGRLLLAYATEDEKESIIARSVAAKASGAKRLSVCRKPLEEIRKSGVSTAESETIEGVKDIAVLVGHPASRITAALAVTRLVRKGVNQNDEELTGAMKAAAAQISQTLGLVSIP